MTLTQNIRIQMLGTDDTATLSDAYLALLIADAKEFTGISDEASVPLRYYTCYLVATNWDSINAIARREGVEYRAPDPNKYLELYNDFAQVSIDITTYGEPYAQKVSTDRDLTFNDDNNMVRLNDTN